MINTLPSPCRSNAVPTVPLKSRNCVGCGGVMSEQCPHTTPVGRKCELYVRRELNSVSSKAVLLSLQGPIWGWITNGWDCHNLSVIPKHTFVSNASRYKGSERHPLFRYLAVLKRGEKCQSRRNNLVINVKFLLQPQQKYYIAQYGGLCFL